jgi:hypothetical protein
MVIAFIYTEANVFGFIDSVIGWCIGVYNQLDLMHQALATNFSVASIRLAHNKSPRSSFNWTNYHISLQNKILLTNAAITKHTNDFWSEKIEKISNDKHILIQFKIKFENGEFATLGQLQRINVDEKDYLINYLVNIISIKSNSYTSTPIVEIFFSYGIRDGRIEPKQRFVENNLFQRYNGYKIPLTMDPLKYGKLISKIGSKYHVQINPKNIAVIDVGEIGDEMGLVQFNRVEIFASGDLILEFTDEAYPDGKGFTRKFGNTQYSFEDGELVLVSTLKKLKPLGAKEKQDELSENSYIL